MRSHLREVLLFAVALAISIPAAALAAPSPTKLVASILAAARAERSVHYVNAISIGAVRIRVVCDAGVAQGIQQITFHKGARTGHVTVIVSADTAYIRGDAFTLVNYMAFNAAPAAKYAGTWVLVPRTDRDYSTVSAGVRLPSVIAQLNLVPLSRLSNTTIDGERVVGVKGKRSTPAAKDAAVTLYARAVGTPRPVQEVTSQGSARATVTFSKWNEPLHVAAPAKAVPIAKTGLE
jgi:hypothetical protein